MLSPRMLLLVINQSLSYVNASPLSLPPARQQELNSTRLSNATASAFHFPAQVLPSTPRVQNATSHLERRVDDYSRLPRPTLRQAQLAAAEYRRLQLTGFQGDRMREIGNTVVRGAYERYSRDDRSRMATMWVQAGGIAIPTTRLPAAVVLPQSPPPPIFPQPADPVNLPPGAIIWPSDVPNPGGARGREAASTYANLMNRGSNSKQALTQVSWDLGRDYPQWFADSRVAQRATWYWVYLGQASMIQMGRGQGRPLLPTEPPRADGQMRKEAGILDLNFPAQAGPSQHLSPPARLPSTPGSPGMTDEQIIWARRRLTVQTIHRLMGEEHLSENAAVERLTEFRLENDHTLDRRIISEEIWIDWAYKHCFES